MLLGDGTTSNALLALPTGRFFWIFALEARILARLLAERFPDTIRKVAADPGAVQAPMTQEHDF